jgi:transcriptional regulator of nitric oxide reductase
LYQLYEKKGYKNKAFDTYKNYSIMKDSLENDESRKLVQQQRLEFEFEKAKMIEDQKEIERQKALAAKVARRNTLQNSLIFLAILLSFAIIFSFGFLKISPRFGQILIFGSLLIFFEFLLVLTDPYLDRLTNGVPIYKLLANSVLAFSIFPLHAWMEKQLKNKVNKLP